jgi:hypothetical protein
MKVQLLSHYQYSQKIVSFLIILFAFSSCVSDEKTTYRFLWEIGVVDPLVWQEFAMKFLTLKGLN